MPTYRVTIQMGVLVDAGDEIAARMIAAQNQPWIRRSCAEGRIRTEDAGEVLVVGCEDVTP